MISRARQLVPAAIVVVAALGANDIALAQSALDGFNPGANATVRAIAVQPDGKILVGGDFTMLGGGGTGTTPRNHIGRLNPDGSLDTSFNPGANGAVRALAVQPDGKVLVAGTFTMLGGGGTGTTSRNRVGRINPDGSLDTSFNPGANDEVFGMAVQPDGKILLGGNFTMLGGGGTGTTPRSFLGRLNADGSLDTSFNPGANGLVWTFAVQPDGGILVGGQFTTLGGGGTGTTTRIAVGRLRADGSLDGAFNPGAYDGYSGSPGVFAMALQADGKIVVGGRFSALGGGTGTTPRACLGRVNPDGSIDAAFDPGANDYVWSLAAQPDGRILVGGNFFMLGGGGTGTTIRYHLGRLKIDGSVDPDFYPGTEGWVTAIVVQPDGKILAGGSFSGSAEYSWYIARLHPDGSVDVNFGARADNAVFDLALQPDGRILVGGSFTMLDDGTGYWSLRSHIGRFNPDGTVDDGFNPGANANIAALAVQPDGKILVGGCFTALGGGGTGNTTRYYLARLHPDGSIDTGFDPGANDCVNAIAVQPDGKILVGGDFSMLGGGGTGTTSRWRLGRLNADGSLDTAFNPGADDLILGFAIQPDGKILVGGWFHSLGGGGTGYYSRYHFGRLNPDGSMDGSFNPGANDDVTAMVVQPDGKILVSGWFTTIGGGYTGYTARNHIARLNDDGSIDGSFDPGVNYGVWDLALQTDGKIVVGGWFTGMGGGTGTTARNNIGRFNPDGSLDTSFDPGANDAVYALALQPDGRVVAGGGFTALGGGGSGTAIRHYIGRVANPALAFEALSLNESGSVATWMRSGSSPEVWRVSFDWSLDGVTYTPLGEGVRVTGGWKLGGLSLPKGQNLFVRARGSYATGFANGDGSMTGSVRLAWLAAGGGGDIITTVAGTGTAAFSGDGGPATAAGVMFPFDVAVDGAGNIYLTDHMNHRIRKVRASNGTITTVAGTGVQGSSGDGGPATAAQINTPTGLAVDAAGNVYIADNSACVVRKVTAATGVISTVAGTGTCAFNGDGRAATATWLYNPHDVAVDAAGNLYISDFGNSRIRKVAASTGIATTLAGTGGFGYGGDGGQATLATLYNPTGMAVDSAGNVYIADTNNCRVRKVTVATGIVTTVAGTGTGGFSGDGGPGTAAMISLPFGLAVDAAGNLSIADQFSHRVRKVAGATGIITTVAGTGSAGFSGDSGPAAAAALNYPTGVAVDAAGLLYIADTQNNRIRKVGPAPPRQGRGDFTGDFKSDILWRHAGGGDVWLWPMDGAARTAETYVRTVADTDWEIRGQGDQDGDGQADILWRNKVNGQIYFWPMDGSTPLDEIYVATVDPAYDIVGTGDFNGDGRSDILWQHTTAGDVWIWLMDGATPLSQVYIDRVPLRYRVRGVGDLDADAKADIVWHSATTGEVWVWLMDGTTRLSQTWVATVPDPGYRIQAVDDFNGDRKADILWWHVTTGEVWIWTMDGPTRVAETWVATVPDTNYRIAGTGDYDGDGKADILWHHATRGEVWIWLMDGTTRVSESWIATVPDVGYLIASETGPALTTITFAGLTAYGFPFGMYTESGFMVTADSTDWVANGYGAPGPSIVFYGSDGTTLTREVHVAAAGSTFNFIAVDLYSSITQIPYEIVGLRNSAVVFSMTGTVPNTYGNFRTVAHPTGSETIDTLVIRLSNPANNPMGLDNIVLRR